MVVSEVGISGEGHLNVLFKHIVIGNANIRLWLNVDETNEVNAWLQELVEAIRFAVGIKQFHFEKELELAIVRLLIQPIAINLLIERD